VIVREGSPRYQQSITVGRICGNSSFEPGVKSMRVMAAENGEDDIGNSIDARGSET